MKKILSIIVVSLLLSVNAANSHMKYGKLKELIKSDPTTLDTYIYGLKSGIQMYEIFMKKYSPDGVKFYCVPPKFELTTENSINIINNEAERLQKKKPKENVDDVIVPILYMWGMQKTFPCEN